MDIKKFEVDISSELIKEELRSFSINKIDNGIVILDIYKSNCNAYKLVIHKIYNYDELERLHPDFYTIIDTNYFLINDYRNIEFYKSINHNSKDKLFYNKFKYLFEEDVYITGREDYKIIDISKDTITTSKASIDFFLIKNINDLIEINKDGP